LIELLIQHRADCVEGRDDEPSDSDDDDDNKPLSASRRTNKQGKMQQSRMRSPAQSSNSHNGEAEVDRFPLTSFEMTKRVDGMGVSTDHTEVAPQSNVTMTAALLKNAQADTDPAHRFVVCCDGSHYRLVIIMAGNQWLLYDSLGLHNTFRNNVWKKVSKLFPSVHLTDLILTTQTDVVNCGVWVIWAAEVWVAHVRQKDTRPFQGSLVARAMAAGLTHVTTTTTQACKDRNLQHILAMKHCMRTDPCINSNIGRTMHPDKEMELNLELAQGRRTAATSHQRGGTRDEPISDSDMDHPISNAGMSPDVPLTSTRPNLVTSDLRRPKLLLLQLSPFNNEYIHTTTFATPGVHMYHTRRQL
jgi:hypothetical protein